MSKLALNAPGPSQREAARKNIQTYGLEFSKLLRFVELRPVLYQSFALSVPGSECAIIIISQPASQAASQPASKPARQQASPMGMAHGQGPWAQPMGRKSVRDRFLFHVLII